MIITERDLKFLKLIALTGACDSKIPKLIYPARYSRNRLEKLEQEGYIVRRYNLIILGEKGLQKLKEEGVICKDIRSFSLDLKRKYASTLNIKLKFDELNLKTLMPTEYKKSKGLNAGMQFIFVLQTKYEGDYFVYYIKKNSKKSDSIIAEIKDKKNIIDKAIVISDDKDIIKKINSTNISKLYIIPNEKMFFALLNILAKEKYDKKIFEIAYKKDFSNINIEDFKHIKDKKIYINMTLNNIYIFEYIKKTDILLYNLDSEEKQNIEIVCFNFQENYIRNRIKSLKLKKSDIEIKTIELEEII